MWDILSIFHPVSFVVLSVRVYFTCGMLRCLVRVCQWMFLYFCSCVTDRCSLSNLKLTFKEAATKIRCTDTCICVSDFLYACTCVSCTCAGLYIVVCTEIINNITVHTGTANVHGIVLFCFLFSASCLQACLLYCLIVLWVYVSLISSSVNFGGKNQGNEGCCKFIGCSRTPVINYFYSLLFYSVFSRQRGFC